MTIQVSFQIRNATFFESRRMTMDQWLSGATG
jgi:hypothetical protein